MDLVRVSKPIGPAIEQNRMQDF